MTLVRTPVRKVIKMPLVSSIHYVEPYFGGGSVFFRRNGTQSPIPYHGGKHYLADWIVSHMPEGVRNGFNSSSILNDIDGLLTNFWRTLQNEQRWLRFKRIVDMVPTSHIEWDQVQERFDSPDPIEQAVGLFIQARQSRQGIGNDERRSFLSPVRSRLRRGMQDQVSRWWTAIDGLDDVRECLGRAFIENMDAIALIEREDSPHTFFYCDPPYLTSTRKSRKAYRYEYTRKQHLALLWALSKIQGKFMLSGYWSNTYAEACRSYGWKQHRKTVAKPSAAGTMDEEGSKATEYIWCNYELN